jgi:hypothetical protein
VREGGRVDVRARAARRVAGARVLAALRRPRLWVGGGFG